MTIMQSGGDGSKVGHVDKLFGFHAWVPNKRSDGIVVIKDGKDRKCPCSLPHICIFGQSRIKGVSPM